MVKAKKTKTETKPGKNKGDQGYLLDVGPKHLEELNNLTGRYKAIMKERIALTAAEVQLKTAITECVHNSGIKKLEDGSIQFSIDDWDISLAPTEEKLKITPKKKVTVDED